MHLAPTQQKIGIAGFALLLACLVIGPLWLGSYYDEWREPLINCAAVAVLLLVISSIRKADHRVLHYLFLSAAIAITAQGFWMWYNAWGTFSREPSALGGGMPWLLLPLDSQPFPSLPGSVDRAETMDKISYILLCVWLAWGTRNLVISRRGRLIRTILTVIFWTGVTVSALGLAQKWTGAEALLWMKSMKSNWDLFFGTYRSPGIASCYLNVALAGGLSILISPRRKHADDQFRKIRIIRVTLIVVGISTILSGIVAAGSKAGCVFSLITIILWGVMNRQMILASLDKSLAYFPGNRHLERNLVVGVLILTCLIGMLSFASTSATRWKSAHDSDYGSLTSRMAVNMTVIESFLDPELEWGALGHGPGSFYPLYPFINTTPNAQTNGVYYYVHNDYLQTLFEWGWLGTLWFAILIAGACVILIREIIFQKRKYSQRDTVHLRGCLIAMSVFLAHATVDFPFQIESIAVTFSVLLGIAWAAPSLHMKKKRAQIRRSAAPSDRSE